MSAAIYLRVSTDDQDAENQEPECVRLCQARGWDFSVVPEVQSGAKARPRWQHVLELARRGTIRAVVIWSIDRMGRRMHEVVSDVCELDRLGCAVVSVCEPWLDTSGPTRNLLLAIFAWVAEHERQRLRERTMAGLERAKAQGKKLGRPKAWVDTDRLARWAARGVPLNQLARRFRVTWNTVRDRLREMGPLPSPIESPKSRAFRDTI